MSIRKQADGSYLLRWLEGGKAGRYRSRVLRDVTDAEAAIGYERLKKGLEPIPSRKRKRVTCDALREWKRNRDQERQKVARENKARFVGELGGRCLDCGIGGDPIIFDFDHRDPAQKQAIPSKLLRSSWDEDIRRELAKCDLVCSNCHRIRTRNRGHYTYRKAA